MHIELIGCSGAGKSTLINKILNVCQDNNIEAYTDDQFVLHVAKLNWIRSYIGRTILVDVISFFSCLFFFRQNLKLYRLINDIVRRLPTTVSYMEKVNILRNTYKKIGSFEIIKRKNLDKQVILLDEGTLHTAHYLFVQTGFPPAMHYLDRFLALIPLPDAVIYLQQAENVLIDRTLSRGHKRIQAHSSPMVKKFIEHALCIFNRIEHEPSVRSKLIIIDEQYQIKQMAGSENLILQQLLTLIHAVLNPAEIKQKEVKYA